jgi:hypothetical protein
LPGSVRNPKFNFREEVSVGYPRNWLASLHTTSVVNRLDLEEPQVTKFLKIPLDLTRRQANFFRQILVGRTAGGTLTVHGLQKADIDPHQIAVFFL